MYQPREIDIQFAKFIVFSLADGGRWGAPADKLIYQIDHKSKQLMLVNSEQLAVEESRVVHERAKAVFAAVGYEVTDAVKEAA